MKYFGFFTLGVTIPVSLFYGQFTIFCMSVFVTIILTMSVAKRFWNEPNKKSASARQH